MGIEHDELGNRAKAYLYCLETRCPETGWMVPLSPSWVVSPRQCVIAKLIPNHDLKRFDIELEFGVSAAQIEAAQQGTVREGDLVYELNGKVPIARPSRPSGVIFETAMEALEIACAGGKNWTLSRVPMTSFKSGYTQFNGSLRRRLANLKQKTFFTGNPQIGHASKRSKKSSLSTWQLGRSKA